MRKIKELAQKSKNTLREEGISGLTKKGVRYLYFKVGSLNRKYDRGFKDILFINGCSLPHPQRYRVDHQIEQLESYGLSCDKIYYTDLTIDMIRFYRGFIFYRCPFIPVIEDFIKIAKENNKTCFFDIDDLVFDVEDTKMIKAVKNMTKEERDLYNDGVKRMGKTLDLCEYGIASTNRLQAEMEKHLKEVYVNRNVASLEMSYYSEKALKEVKKDTEKVIMGYLSGSITHNDDFKLIMPTIIKILKKYDNVYLEIVGLLDLPDEMKEVENKIITAPFMDWKELPNLIRSIDINLAPLENSIFNEAKSENKWTEAALVKIPTIASNVGAFNSEIEHNETGVLCKTAKDWEENLSKLIENKDYREKIGEKAYQEVTTKKVTIKSGLGITEFIKSKLRKNVCFVLPSPNISGGIMVAIKHGLILKKNGYDVTMINLNKETNFVDKVFEKEEYLFTIGKYRTEFLQYIDTMVATMWLTLEFVRKYHNNKNKKYLVQGMESEFYKFGEYEKVLSNATYNNVINIDYLTISKWCQGWLKEEFNTTSKYAPNGIDLSIFPIIKRDFKEKIKILIEGNCKDYKKNVDESFKITNKLDRKKYEIHYLSYEKEPKRWYRVDVFHHKVPHDEVGKIYSQCDILLKTSILESFSYPPLEMMATGGLTVVVPNGGNSEFLKDNENCLLYEQGNIEEAIAKIEELRTNKDLRDKLIKNGLKTAKSREWKSIEKNILELYFNSN